MRSAIADQGPAAGVPGVPGKAVHDAFLAEPEHAEVRMASYLGLAFALLVGALIVRRFDLVAGPYVHTLLETIATVLAFVIGSLALVRFYSRKRRTFLFLGTGFLGTAFLDGYHAVVTSPSLAPLTDPGVADLTAWTWIASRVFLSLFLFVSWLTWHQEETGSGSRADEPVDEVSVYMTAGVLTLIMFVFFARIPLAGAYHPELWISRPGELIPGFFFSLALAGYLTKREWKGHTFEHWIVVALIISVATHVGFLAFSSEQHDLPVIAAHLLKIASYLAVLVGLMASVYLTFRREGEASEAILEANAELAHEVGVRAKAERILQEGEERLQDFLDNANDLIQITDPMGRLTYVNEAWRRTLGYAQPEIDDLNILSVVHPDFRDSFRKLMQRAFQGESLSGVEVVFRAKDGSRVTCSGSANCRFEDGLPVATRSILRNVTDERRAAGELVRSQANVRALFESTGDAIWSVDPARRLITFNTAYALTVEAITGRAPSVGDPVSSAVLPEDVAWYDGCYDRALAGTRFSAVREEEVGGQQRIYELFFNPIEGEDRTGGVVVFSKDITRRRGVEQALKRAKQEADEANRSKSQFMANMSHELRTPLNSVIGFGNILLKDRAGRLGEKERGFLERILANGKHLLSLINEILDLSKVEAGQMELELARVELVELVRETLGQLEGQLGGKPVAFRAEVDGDPAPILTDPGKLKQVLINLVGNALKFTEQGEVLVRVETDTSGRVAERIRVSDTGVGIPADRLEAVFEAFQQADGSTTRRFGGTGLGLTISRSLCALMGYRISVESTVGEGSTFTIHLAPAPQELAEAGMRELSQPPRSRWAPARFEPREELAGRTVLVVDDEVDSRTLLSGYLQELGCRVVTAVDGIEGLETARRERPDLITVELMMPRMSGWEMLRALRDDVDLRGIPAVVVSMVAEEGAERLLGAVDLLSKPVDREELLRVLRRNMSKEAGRVLVVDDNPDTRLILQRYLREAGLVSHTVESGEAALELLGRAEVDLILLDFLMPVVSGLDLLERLKAGMAGPPPPVVILTAKELSADEERRVAEQGSRVIVKSAGVESRLRELLDGHFGVEEPSEPTG